VPNRSSELEKRCWRNIKSFAQFLDVGVVKVTFLMQDFGYDAFRAKDRKQIFLAQIIKPATVRLSELPSRGRVPSQISVSGSVSGSLLGRISGMGIQAGHLSLPLRYTVVMASTNDVIVKDPDILGGTPVFRGTRVPLQALLDSLEGGETLEEFLEGFPTVTREMAIAALEDAQQLLSGKS
jgi:uncharacterized protein (DUF433 family)